MLESHEPTTLAIVHLNCSLLRRSILLGPYHKISLVVALTPRNAQSPRRRGEVRYRRNVRIPQADEDRYTTTALLLKSSLHLPQYQ